MKEKGSVLISTVWSLSFFALLIANLSFNVSQHVLLLKKQAGEFEGRLNTYSALQFVLEKIHTDSTPYQDSFFDDWYGTLIDEAGGAKNQKESSENPVPVVTFLEILDEEAKINLNETSEDFLEKILEKISDEKQSLHLNIKTFIKSLLKYRDEGDLIALEEILLFEGMDARDFQVLSEHLTVYPEYAEINLNTATPFVIETLIHSLSGDSFAKSKLFTSYLDFHETQNVHRFFISEDLVSDIFMNKLELPKTPQMIQLIHQFLRKVTVDSRTFQIKVREKKGKETKIIIRQHIDWLKPEVIFWYET